MPQPFSGDLTDEKHRALEKRPKCAVLMASIANEWAHVEHQMLDMFGAATGTTRRVGEGMWSTDPNDLAEAVLGTLESLNTKINVVKAAWDAIKLPADLKANFDAIDKGLRSCARERNRIVHGFWTIADQCPDDVILQGRHGDLSLYSTQDFEAILDRILGLQGQITMFRFECTARKAGFVFAPEKS